MLSDKSKGIITKKAIGPAADEFGKEVAILGKEAGELTVRVGRLLLKPLQGVVYGIEFCSEWLREAVTERLDKVSPEDIVEPDPRIAVPATQALTYSMADEFIREMFADLLATDMNTKTKSQAHPAFVEIIKQMTSEDARTLKVLKSVRACAFLLRVGKSTKFNDLGIRYSFHVEGVKESDIPRSISSLQRLGIIEMRTEHPVGPEYDEMVKKIEARMQPVVERMNEMARHMSLDPNPKLFVARRGIYITPLGQSFVAACFRERKAKNVPTPPSEQT